MLDALSQGHYFDALPRHSLNELAYIMDVIKLEKGSYLFKPGDQAKCIYLIAHGNLEISMTINEKHLHLLKAHENLPDIEPAPRIPKKHTTLDDYEAYNFDIFKAESLKKRADIVPIQNQKGIVGAIKLDEELPEQTSFIGDYPQEIILGNIGQGSLISSRKVFMKENYQFQCKAQTNATVYVLKLETLEDLAKHNTEFDYEINKIKAENEGKKFGDFLDVIQQDEGDSIRIQKLWASAIIRVILGLRQERRGGSALLLQITSKLKAIIACEEANNFDLAEKVIRGDIPPHYIQEDGTLDPAAINASLDSTLPRSHPIMIAFRDILDSITQPGGNIVRQYNALEKTILQQSKQIQTYDNYLNDLKTTLTKVIDKLKGKDYEAPITDRNKEIIKLDIQKVYLAQEARQKRRDERKAKKVQKKNDRGSSNEAVIRPKESEGSKDLLSFIKESKD